MLTTSQMCQHLSCSDASVRDPETAGYRKATEQSCHTESETLTGQAPQILARVSLANPERAPSYARVRINVEFWEREEQIRRLQRLLDGKD